MLDLAHYFYFLSSEEEAFEKAWEGLSKRYGLQEVDVSPLFREGLILSRTAKNREQDHTLSLLVMKHSTAIEFCISGEEPLGLLGEIKRAKEAIEDCLLTIMGESTFIIQPAEDLSFLPKEKPPLKTGVKEGELLVLPEEPYKRLYVFVSGEEEKALARIRKTLAPLDCLIYQQTRQARYYDEQRRTLLNRKEEMDKNISSILFHKRESLEELDADAESLSEIYSRMANNSFLIGSALHTLRADLTELEAKTMEAVPGKDDFFYGQLAALKNHIYLINSAKENFSFSLDNVKAAIDVVKSRVDIARGRMSLKVQEDTLTMGIAASLVEFFIVLYYGLELWSMLISPELFHKIPVILTAAFSFAFSLSVVAGTHKAAKAIKRKTLRGIWIWPVIIVALIASMAGVSLFYSF